MSDAWSKPKSLRDIADDISSALPDDEIGGAPDTAPNPSPSPDAPMDEITVSTFPTTGDIATDRNIAQLHPAIRNDVANFVNDVKDRTGQQLRIGGDSGFRTFEQQDAAYAKGRTKPGNIVTDAVGGQSYHNYGLGFDIAGLKPNGKDITYELPYPKIGQIARNHGFEWGGNWSKPDRPHFQRTYGYTTGQLRGMVGTDSPYPAIPDARLKGTR